MLKPWRVEMKRFKYAVVYSIALAVASIGLTPVVTLDAYGASKTQARSPTAAGVHFKQAIITTVRSPTAPKANPKVYRPRGGSLYSYPVQRPEPKIESSQFPSTHKGTIRNFKQ